LSNRRQRVLYSSSPTTTTLSERLVTTSPRSAAIASGLIAVADTFRGVLGYDKKQATVPTKAVKIPIRTEKIKVNIHGIATKRSDSTVEGIKAVGVTLTPYSVADGPFVVTSSEATARKESNQIMIDIPDGEIAE
jgi:hypothetical protein